MSDTGQHEPDEHDAVRRLLKSLPKVEASPDFELRLQRDLRQERPSSAAPRRIAIPVYAYSLLTLLVVTVVSYYTFFRVSDTPAVPRQTSPMEGSTPAIKPPARLAPNAGGPSSTSKGAAPEIAPPSRPDAVPRTSSTEDASPGPSPRHDSLPRQAPAEEQKDKSQTAGEVQAPAATGGDGKAATSLAAPQNEMRVHKKEEEPALPEESPVKGIIPFQPPVLKAAAAPARRVFEAADAPAVVDSAAHQDSLARDSVRSKEQRRLNERLQKRKRPVE